MSAKREKPKTSPLNPRQRKAVQALLENGGKSVSKAMEKAGYSKAYSKNPQKLTATKTWQDYMDEYLPDKLIAEKHRALLEKEDKDGIDVNAVKAGVDMGYKLKKRYENPDQTVIIRRLKDMSDEELDAYIDARLKQTKSPA